MALTINSLTTYDLSLYGLAFHHYWFGYPVMDKPLQAMLEDGQPDVPFMLSWANEPWTVRWDGNSWGDGTLLAQEYGDSAEWRRHFDWMATYFRHPRYIRCAATGHVQLSVYAPHLAGEHAAPMFDRWRRWAAEDPAIGGLDVVETLWQVGFTGQTPHTDAVGEFAPHSGGQLDMTAWERNARAGRVHHRGVMVSWDNAPRHATDDKSDCSIWVHPELWKSE